METTRGLNRFGRLALVVIVAALVAAACSSSEQPETDVAVRAEPLDDAASDGDDDSGQSTDAGATESQDAADGDEAAGQQDGPTPTVGQAAEAVGPILEETGQDLAGPDLEQYLARRFEAYWQAFDIARQAPTADPGADYPELFNLAAGEQLETAYSELGDLFESGHAIREPESPAVPGLDANSAHRVRIESLEEGVAELVSCLVNDQVRYEVGSGAIVSDSVRTVQARSTMAKAEGTWKLIRSEAVGLDAGVAGCWLEGEDQFPY